MIRQVVLSEPKRITALDVYFPLGLMVLGLLLACEVHWLWLTVAVMWGAQAAIQIHLLAQQTTDPELRATAIVSSTGQLRVNVYEGDRYVASTSAELARKVI